MRSGATQRTHRTGTWLLEVAGPLLAHRIISKPGAICPDRDVNRTSLPRVGRRRVWPEADVPQEYKAHELPSWHFGGNW